VREREIGREIAESELQIRRGSYDQLAQGACFRCGCCGRGKTKRNNGWDLKAPSPNRPLPLRRAIYLAPATGRYGDADNCPDQRAKRRSDFLS
jgi:hypothetical protein